MKTKILFLLIFTTYYNFLASVDIDQVKSSENYYWGEYESVNNDIAYETALQRMINNISVFIEASTENSYSEINNVFSEKTESSISLNSYGNFNNIQIINENNNNVHYYFIYLKKSDFATQKSSMENLIIDLYLLAEKYEDNLNYGYALKYYYYSLILAKSMAICNLTHNNQSIITLLIDKINNIMLNTEVSIINDKSLSNEHREIILYVTSNNSEVSFLSLSYWNGHKNIDIEIKNGKGIVNLYGSSTEFERLQMKIKYDYSNGINEITELAKVWGKIDGSIAFENQITVALKDPVIFSRTESEINVINNSIDENINKIIVTRANKMVLFFNENIDLDSNEFDIFVRKKADEIKNFNNTIFPNIDNSLKLNKTKYGWELRSITVSNEYPSLNLHKTDSIIMDFDEEGKLIDLNFAVNDALYDKFVEQAEYGNDWENRLEIIKFLEKYRTAFQIRSEDTIDAIFAEESIIIVGREIRNTKMIKDVGFHQKINQPSYSYLTLSKKEYLQRLSKVFKKQKDINIGFSDFKILRKNNQPNIYGISLRQQYNSTSYSDNGYLFLLIDFQSDQPQIYVRAWQPNTWDENKLIKLSNFKINN